MALSLELDPRVETFRGQVELSLQIERATSTLWLHAVGLVIERAELTGAAAPVPLRVRTLAHGVLELTSSTVLRPGPGVVHLRYRGQAGEAERGLFRRQLDGAWYLLSQGQAQYARRIAPCFDEPRWKVPWRVTITAPAQDVVLGNAPSARVEQLADGRRRHELEPTEPMASYLVALAVGPLELVPVGALGQGQVPVRLAVPRGARARTAMALELVPRAVAAVERALALPLPGRKLDLVAVPGFFGGMENPGLILLDAEHVLGGPSMEAPEALGHRPALARLLVHELAHQWLGNEVTPATWRELWFSEGLATWVAQEAGLPELEAEHGRALSWVQAVTDPAVARRGLRRWPGRWGQPSARELEELGDPVVYDKGALVVGSLAHWLGGERLRAALRELLARHRGGHLTGEEVALALRPLHAGAPRALIEQLDHVGTPHVRAALRCPEGGPARLVIEGPALALPVCVRFAGDQGVQRRCELVRGRSEWTLGACPAWLALNDDVRGAYTWSLSLPEGHPRRRLPWPPAAEQTRAERVALGAERRWALSSRGEVAAALRYLRESARAMEEGERAAALERALYDLELIAALEPLVAEDDLSRWRQLVADYAAGVWHLAPSLQAGSALERWVAWRTPVRLAQVSWPLAAVAAARRALEGGGGERGGVRGAGAGDERRERAASGGTQARVWRWRVALRTGGKAAEQSSRDLLEELTLAPTPLRTALLSVLGALPREGLPLLWRALDESRVSWSEMVPELVALLARRDLQEMVMAQLLSRAGRLRTALAPVEVDSLGVALARLCTAHGRVQAEALLLALGASSRVRSATERTIERCRVARQAFAAEVAKVLGET